MSISSITAKVECDGCGALFLLELDAAASRNSRVGKWTLDDLVTDQLRNGINFRGYVSDKRPLPMPCITMVFENEHYCPICTNTISHQLTGRGAKLTKEMIAEFLEPYDDGE